MSLKDTLGGLDEAARKRAEAEARRPVVIAAWQKAVTDLYAEIEQYLSEYVAAGSIKTARGSSRHNEERLGSYECPTMTITAGNAVVTLKNRGRVLFGCTGAIDMTRAGKPQQAVLSRHSDDEAPAAQWHVNIDPKARHPGKPRPPVYPLDKKSFELGLDYLLKA